MSKFLKVVSIVTMSFLAGIVTSTIISQSNHTLKIEYKVDDINSDTKDIKNIESNKNKS